MVSGVKYKPISSFVGVWVAATVQVPLYSAKYQIPERFMSSAADRFRRGARSVGNEAEKVRGQAADLGKDVLQRLSHEVEHRPLVILAVAIGVGILIGLVSNRR